MAKDTVEVLIEGGTATPGPPLGPALGPFGINMMQVVEEINKKSADFAGMKVPRSKNEKFNLSVSYRSFGLNIAACLRKKWKN